MLNSCNCVLYTHNICTHFPDATGIAYSRVDNEEFIKINFKAFRNNYETMIHEIKEDSIMMMTGKFLNVGSELFVRKFS